MKQAKDWIAEQDCPEEWASVRDVMQIQIDALQHAANMVRDLGGDNEDYHARPIEEAIRKLKQTNPYD